MDPSGEAPGVQFKEALALRAKGGPLCRESVALLKRSMSSALPHPRPGPGQWGGI